MGNLVLMTGIRAPKPAEPMAHRRIAQLAAAVEGSWGALSLVLSRAPNGAERASLLARSTELASALAPRIDMQAKEELLRAVLKFMDTWPGLRLPTKEAKRMADVYVKALLGIPIWAVESTMIAAARGDVGLEPTVFPTSAVLRKHAEKLVEPFIEERALVERVLAARVVADVPPADDAAKARVDDAVAAFKRRGAELAVADEDATRISRNEMILGYTERLRARDREQAKRAADLPI